MPQKTLEELLGGALGALENGAPQYTIKRTRHGVEVHADGQDDHDRAMEALKLMQGVQAQPAPVSMPTHADLEELAPRGIKRITLAKAIEEYTAREKPKDDAGRSKIKTFQGARLPALRDFQTWAKPKTNLHTLTRNDLAHFATYLMADRGLDKSTANNKLNYVSTFFDWAQSAQYYPKGDNPAKGHVAITARDKAQRAKRGWQAFNQDQLKTLFSPDNFNTFGDNGNARWLALLALYTGARSNELAQLDLVDCYKIGNQPVIEIVDVGEGMSVKTKESKRIVPIHPDLIELGLWDRVESLQRKGETRLFPTLNRNAQNGPAQPAQKAFLKYLKAVGITARGNGKMGLHSFRSTVITQMTRSGVPQGWRELYVGHEQTEAINTQTTAHTVSYTQSTFVEQLAKQVHPSLTWSEILDLPNLKLVPKA